MVGSTPAAAAVLCACTEPVPGVSTISTPLARIGESRRTVIAATPRELPGLPRSVPNSPSADSGQCAARPSANATTIASPVPCVTVVGTAVSGVIPVGSTSRPSSAFTSVLLPRLASPTTSTRSRAARSRSRSAGHLGGAHTASHLFRQGPSAAMPRFDGGPLRRRLGFRLARPPPPPPPPPPPRPLPLLAALRGHARGGGAP